MLILFALIVCVDSSLQNKSLKIGLLSVAFAWKTYEYIGNRFCYTDVRLILIYKMVLECLILETNQKEQKEL